MRLQNLYKSYQDMSYDERVLYCNKLREKRIVIEPPKKTRKKSKPIDNLTEEEKILVNKVLGKLR